MMVRQKADQLLRDYYESAGFSAGLIHGAVGCDKTGEVLLVQSKGSSDCFNCLWQVTGPGLAPKLIFDNQTLASNSERPESAAEKQARERARKLTSGVDSLNLSKDGLVLTFTAQGRLIIGRRATKQPSWQFSDSGVAAPFGPKLSPTGQHVAVMTADNFQIFQLVGNNLKSLTIADCPEGLGRNDFVSAEEIHRRSTYTWSASGRFMAAILADSSDVSTAQVLGGSAPHFNNQAMPYPFAGSQNAKQSIWWLDVDKATARQLPLPTGFDCEYLVTVDFYQDELRCVWQNRSQRQTAAYAWRKNRWVKLFGQTDAAWVPVNEAKYLLDQAEPVWLDESGAYAVIRQGKHGCAFKPSAPIALLGYYQDEVLTLGLRPDRSSGVFSCNLAQASCKELEPTGLVARAITVGKALLLQTRLFDANQADMHWQEDAVQQLTLAQPPKISAPVLHQVSTAVSVAVKLPPGEGPFPVIFDTYAGPEFDVTTGPSAGFVVAEWFCSHGFAVVSVDGRGAPLPNRNHERQLLDCLADCVLEDQISGLEYAFSQYPQLDRKRISVRGWSFGGYFALLCAARRPKLFKAAIAGAPVTNWQWYDTHYTERYLGGGPVEQAKAYAHASVLTAGQAPQIPTLLIHGLADDNVLVGHSLAYLATHQSDQVTFVPLMSATHMASGTALRLALIKRELEFLNTHL